MESGPLKKQVRLRVAYKTPENLVGELTKSVGRGGVRIESAKKVAVGTAFVFELQSAGVKERVEVSGVVASVSESAPGRYVLHIRYEPPKNRLGIEAVIQRIFDVGQADKNRKSPRVPVQVRAVEDRPGAPNYRIHDLSKGGVGIDVEGSTVPSHIAIGAPFLMQVRLATGPLSVHGEVAWAVNAQRNSPLLARFGVAFGTLSPQTLVRLEDLITLKALPAPPWIAKLAFGDEALAQMG